MIFDEEKSLLDAELSDVLWLGCVVLLLFSSTIQNLTGFSYLDELITCLLIAGALLRLAGEWRSDGLRLPRLAFVAVFSIVLLLATGLLSNYIYGYNGSTPSIIVDVFTCLKFPVALLSSLYLFSGRAEEILNWLEAIVKPFVVLLFLLAVANLFFDFGMGIDPRYGLRASFKFLCGHPTYLVILCVGLAILFVRNIKRNKVFFILTLLVIASSLRSKGIVFCVLALAMLYFMRGEKKLNVLHVLVCVVAAVVIGWDQYSGYYQAEGSARSELVRASIEIAGDFFPLGTGFATFGSNSSAVGNYYSPVYLEYGIDKVWGLTQESHPFLSDTFWPTLLGQFGVLGLVVYLLSLGSTFYIAYTSGRLSRIPTVLCFLYLLISSTAESAFFNPMSVYLAVILGLLAASSASQGYTNKELLESSPSDWTPNSPSPRKC